MSIESRPDAAPIPAEASAPVAEPSPESMSESITDPLDMDRYECLSCGYFYEPTKGDSVAKVAANTPFSQLPSSWRCPVCGARQDRFENIGPKEKPSGFKENLGYGIGVNLMTPTQKSLLIFGGLGIAFLLMLSLYGLN